ncbi:hypothetical protein [Promicromonospora soli]|nr:hypothetical protein [Promicromonospora soli]
MEATTPSSSGAPQEVVLSPRGVLDTALPPQLETEAERVRFE